MKVSSSSLEWLTPLGKTDIGFLSTLSEDFADFFRSENLVCLRIRAPTFLDRVMFGRLTGKWIGEDALGATMQEFNRLGKPPIWICWENLLSFGSNLSLNLGTKRIRQNLQWGFKSWYYMQGGSLSTFTSIIIIIVIIIIRKQGWPKAVRRAILIWWQSNLRSSSRSFTSPSSSFGGSPKVAVIVIIFQIFRPWSLCQGHDHGYGLLIIQGPSRGEQVRGQWNGRYSIFVYVYSTYTRGTSLPNVLCCCVQYSVFNVQCLIFNDEMFNDTSALMDEKLMLPSDWDCDQTETSRW